MCRPAGETSRSGWRYWPGSLPTIYYVILGHQLVPKFPIFWLMFFAFIWTPVISYISARMYGLTRSRH